MENFIGGGYYIKARKIQRSEISNAPPCIREVWDYLLMMANHSDNHICKRGQHITTVNTIREALSWYAGWRKETYKKSACENAMKWLRAKGMITTKKTTKGTLVTICNYSVYQDPKNYECRDDNSTNADHVPKHSRTINKNEKNEKNDNINIQSGNPTYDFVLDLYKKYCPNLPQVRGLNSKRKSLIKKSLSQNSDEAYYIELFSKANDIPFLKGTGKSNWKANIDFLMRIDRQTAVLEGVYGEPESSNGLNFTSAELEEMYPEKLTESDVAWIGKMRNEDEV